MTIFGRDRDKGRQAAPVRLHVGSGQAPIAGWVNIDIQPLPGVDRVLDVRRGLPYDGVAAIYGEHFLEHLELEEGLACLVECRRALASDGILRLSTPNLDWVLASHYRYGRWAEEGEAVSDCFRMNRAFHGWGHRFLYNRQALDAALRAAGFAKITMHRYGESDVPELSGLERHEKSGDTDELPHVLVAQASGRAEKRPMPRDLIEEYRQALQAR
jgi:predicted SAM-dependent methyltransferase